MNIALADDKVWHKGKSYRKGYTTGSQLLLRRKLRH